MRALDSAVNNEWPVTCLYGIYTTCPSEELSNLYAVPAHSWCWPSHETAGWERDMQRRTLDAQDPSWNSPSETYLVAGCVQDTVGRPSARELYMEAAVVLAVALGVAVIGQFIAAIA